jgi:hypothetical protein
MKGRRGAVKGLAWKIEGQLRGGLDDLDSLFSGRIAQRCRGSDVTKLKFSGGIFHTVSLSLVLPWSRLTLSRHLLLLSMNCNE